MRSTSDRRIQVARYPQAHNERLSSQWKRRRGTCQPHYGPMLAMVCNEHQNDWDVHLPYVEYAYEIEREQHALTVARVNGRNSALSDALLRRPKYTAGGWVWVYNTAATIRQGLRKSADSKVLKEKLSLNWTGPFKILAAGPSPAADTPDGRPLGDKLLYLDLPSNLSDPAAKPRVTVARCKPCANPYDADDIPRHLPAGLTQYVLHAFATKSPPYHVTTDDVSTPPILIDVAKITGHHYWSRRCHCCPI